MSVRSFLKLTAFVTSLLGLVLIIDPSFVANFFLTSKNHSGDVFIRFLGSTLFGYACLNWFTSSIKDKQAIRATIMANLSTLTIAFLISLIALMDDTFNSKGILIVLLHFAFGLGFFVYSLKHDNWYQDDRY